MRVSPVQNETKMRQQTDRQIDSYTRTRRLPILRTETEYSVIVSLYRERAGNPCLSVYLSAVSNWSQK
jgi:hypothetical protein